MNKLLNKKILLLNKNSKILKKLVDNLKILLKMHLKMKKKKKIELEHQQ